MNHNEVGVIFELRKQFERLEDSSQDKEDICSYVVAALSFYCQESAKDQKYKELYFNLLEVFKLDDISKSREAVEEFLIKEEAYVILQGLQLIEK